MKCKIKDIGKHVIYSDGKIFSKSKGFLKGSIIKDGYQRVRIGSARPLVHRLVYETFVGDIPKGMEIDHLNNDRLDNRIENLECVTHQENISRAVKNGSYSNNPKRMGQVHGRSKLDDIKVLTMLTFPSKKGKLNSKYSSIAFSKLYGVARTNISGIRGGRQWKHIHLLLSS